MTDITQLAKQAGADEVNDISKLYVIGESHLLKLEQLLRDKFIAELGEPVAWKYKTNKVHIWITEDEPPEDAYDEGTLKPLYAKKG